MKKTLVVAILCFFVFTLSFNIRITFALNEEQIDFIYNNKIFTYTLSKNIKTSNQFDLNYEINKYNRFSSTADRQQLLKHLLSIGIDRHVAVEYMFPGISKTINKIKKNININPNNATIKIVPDSEHVFQITPEIIGYSLDENLLYAKICEHYLKHNQLQILVPIITTNPQITKSDLKEYIHLRSDFSTSIATSSKDRKHNIKNSLNKINKTEILPNQTFSFNQTVGQRTEENGYKNAKIIINNEFTDGIGGGVCQVSSTLYNSALLAGLEIIEANKHSKQVGYVKSGFDAMVNYGSSDLKFKNNTNNKITIITNFSNNKIRIRIFGEQLNSTYKLVNEITDIIEPTEQIITDTNLEYTDKVKYNDEYFYLKTPCKGLTIKTYREKYVNNTLVNKEFLRQDKYPVQNAIKIVGSIPREAMAFDSFYTHSY